VSPRLSASSRAVALCALVAGCGGSSEAPGRAPFERYVGSVNAIQQGYANDFKAANKAYIAYSRSELDGPAAMAALSKAEIEIRGARDRMKALTPPADARELHRRYVAYMDANVAFAEENAALATYLQGSDVAVGPLDGANTRLRRDLRRAKTPARQEDALKRFAATLRTSLVALRTLDAPAVLRVTHGDQIHRLERTRSLALQLRNGIADRDSHRVALLLVRFRKSASSRGRTKLAAAAIKRYSSHYAGLSTAYTQIRREEIRLRRRFS
jgi:hypothetical protein